MLHENWVIVGALLNLFGSMTYVIKTVKGEVKPNRVTWFLWSVIPFIIFTAQIKQGVGLQALMSASIGFVPVLVFIASFLNKKAYWKIGRLDIICLILSLVGLLLWYITKIGNAGIFFFILADALAAIPTIVKSYWAPETEDDKVYFFGAIGALLTLLTIKVWNFETAGFALYVFFLSTLLTILVRFKLGKSRSF